MGLVSKSSRRGFGAVVTPKFFLQYHDSNEEEAMLPQSGGTQTETAKAPQYLVTFAATLLVFSGGTTLGWSSPALHMLNQKNSTLPIHPTENEGSWISSLLTIGALIGALPAGSVADMMGRKLTMLLLPMPILLSWAIIIFSIDISLIYAARLIAGIGLGAICTIVPMYIAEIAEDSVRGTLCSTFQLMLCIGILFTYSVGAVSSYHTMAVCCSIVPVVFIFAFLRAPETPVFLLKRGLRKEAEQALKKLRGDQCNTAKELHALENDVTKPENTKTSFAQALSRRDARMAVIISLGIMIFQQFSGINVVIFYSSKIFEATGAKLDPQICTILVGLAQVGATMLSMVLIDKTGRKLLLLVSAASMAICLGVLGYYFLLKDRGDDVSALGAIPVVAVIAYILLFAIGFGPIPWMMSGEVLSDDIKGVCTGIAVSLNWTLAFVVTFTFQTVVDKIGNASTYWLTSAICVLAILFVHFIVIETKGKSFQDIQNELAGHKSKEDAVV